MYENLKNTEFLQLGIKNYVVRFHSMNQDRSA